MAKSGRVNDSKQLTAGEREELWVEFEELVSQGQIHANFGVASVAEVESVNILGATKLAMRRALEGIYPPAAFEQKDGAGSVCQRSGEVGVPADGVLPDSHRWTAVAHFPYPHQGIVSGDGARCASRWRRSSPR